MTSLWHGNTWLGLLPFSHLGSCFTQKLSLSEACLQWQTNDHTFKVREKKEVETTESESEANEGPQGLMCQP